MFPLGLSRADRAAFHAGLAASHTVGVAVSVLDLDGNRLGRLDRVTDSGQVNLVAGAATRNATLSLLDPDHALGFDSDSPADGALYMNRMLRIEQVVEIPALGKVEVPVFTGPVTKLDRDEAMVSVECQGKERLAMGAADFTMVLPEGMDKVRAIRALLEETGETRFAFPDVDAKLGADIVLTRESVPWELARKIAGSMDRRLFWDALGVARCERMSTNPVFTFATGEGGTVLAHPQVSFSTDDLVNRVIIRGGVPKGATDPVKYVDVADRLHPLSPWKLGRNGKPRFLDEIVDNDAIRSNAEARAVARRRLDDGLRQVADVTFTSLPVPHLDVWDMVRLRAEGYTRDFRLRSASLSLGAEPMTVGWTQQIARPRRRPNRR